MINLQGGQDAKLSVTNAHAFMLHVSRISGEIMKVLKPHAPPLQDRVSTSSMKPLKCALRFINMWIKGSAEPAPSPSLPLRAALTRRRCVCACGSRARRRLAEDDIIQSRAIVGKRMSSSFRRQFERAERGQRTQQQQRTRSLHSLD